MKRLWLLGLMLLSSISVIRADEKPEYVSETFKNIRDRVARWDKDSGAILEVKAKGDAPRTSMTLDFSVEESSEADEAIIVLSRSTKRGDLVVEKYILRPDGAIRQELLNQKKLKELEAQRQAEFVEEQKKKIVALSGGTLKYGMSYTEVIKLKGQPQGQETPAQSSRNSAFIWPNVTLTFMDTQLISIRPTEK